MTPLLCSDGFTSISCVSISPFSSSSSSSTGSLSMAVTAGTISRFALKPTNLPPNSTVGLFVLPPIAASERGALGFKASSDVTDNGDSQSESDEDVPMRELPLDAKLQNKLEKKLKMKVAKKTRLRRKKLVHKRRLRKKGRWPPSKMKKLSSV